MFETSIEKVEKTEFLNRNAYFRTSDKNNEKVKSNENSKNEEFSYVEWDYTLYPSKKSIVNSKQETHFSYSKAKILGKPFIKIRVLTAKFLSLLMRWMLFMLLTEKMVR